MCRQELNCCACVWNREVLECFKRHELLEWKSFQINYEEVLRAGLPDCPATDVFAMDTELGKEQWEDLRKRVIEHVSHWIWSWIGQYEVHNSRCYIHRILVHACMHNTI